MEPFGVPIVIYLFLAGVAAGAGFIGSFALASAEGRRTVGSAVLLAMVGAVFLISDLTKPTDFFLILTKANNASAISWGARILTFFILSGSFLWIATRGTGRPSSVDLLVAWLFRVASLGLAVYPAFVLRQGEAVTLWQHDLLGPLIAVSALHAGIAVARIARIDADKNRRSPEVALGALQFGLLATVLVTAGGSVLAWGVAFGVGTLLPLAFVLIRPAQTCMLRPILILAGMLAMRYWILSPDA